MFGGGKVGALCIKTNAGGGAVLQKVHGNAAFEF
jgi:hypothetical protein